MILPRECRSAMLRALARGWPETTIAETLGLDLQAVKAIRRGAREVPAHIAQDRGPSVLDLAGSSPYHRPPFKFG